MVTKEEIPEEIREQAIKEAKTPDRVEIDRQKIIEKDGEWALEYM